MILRCIWMLMVLFLLSGCSPSSVEVPAENHSEQDIVEDGPTNLIAVPPTIRRNLGITFAKVEVRQVEDTIRIPGAFELQPLARREYHMVLPGRVELLVDQYQPVEPGDLLYRFESPSWPELLHEIILGDQGIDLAHSEILVWEAKVDEAKKKLERVRGRVRALAQADFKRADLEAVLAEVEASLPRLSAELGLAKTRLRNAERTRVHAVHRAATSVDLAEEELDKDILVDGEKVPMYMTIDWIEVKAVESGVVEVLSVTDGSFVEPPTTILSTVNSQLVRFRAMALQADMADLSRATGSRIVPPQSPGIMINDAVEATLTLGLEAHPQERTMPLLAIPERLTSWIRPGVSAFLEVVVASNKAPALAVPRSSVVKDGLTHVFFRRDPSDPNRVIRVEADMGVSDGRWVTIESGLVRGDEVVLNGVYELKLATQNSGTSLKGGHFHADGSYHGDE